MALLDIDHLDGFAVRLHNLGDFYSVEYVELWGHLLERHPGLRIWGYTARIEGPISESLAKLVQAAWRPLRHQVLKCAAGFHGRAGDDHRRM